MELQPDLLAVVGDFVVAFEPHAEKLAGKLLRAADPLALAPLLAEQLNGDELVVLKASRGVALERILPALAARAKQPGAPPAPSSSR
jgi:UDP-N-acetylmuramyl pentapeptide synthase